MSSNQATSFCGVRLEPRLWISQMFGDAKRSESEARAEEAEKKRFFSAMEPHLVKFQALCLWLDPSESLRALCLFNLVFFGLTYVLRFSAITLVILAVMAAFGYYYWVTFVWPVIRVEPTPAELEAERLLATSPVAVPPACLNAREMQALFERVIERMRVSAERFQGTRVETPGGFFAMAAVAFLLYYWAITLLFGSFTMFVYYYCMGLFILPGLFSQVLPDNSVTERMSNFFRGHVSGIPVLEEEVKQETVATSTATSVASSLYSTLSSVSVSVASSTSAVTSQISSTVTSLMVEADDEDKGDDKEMEDFVPDASDIQEATEEGFDPDQAEMQQCLSPSKGSEDDEDSFRDGLGAAMPDPEDVLDEAKAADPTEEFLPTKVLGREASQESQEELLPNVSSSPPSEASSSPRRRDSDSSSSSGCLGDPKTPKRKMIEAALKDEDRKSEVASDNEEEDLDDCFEMITEEELNRVNMEQM